MSPKTVSIEEINETMKAVEKYLWIAIEHRNTIGINRVLFALTEMYRMTSLALKTKLYLEDKDRFDLLVGALRAAIACYGRLGRLLIDYRVEEGFQTYIQFTTDVIGKLDFDYPDDVSDHSEALIIWNDLQRINAELTESRLRTLFLICAKAIHRKNYSLLYALVKEMTTEHPRVVDINKKQLFLMLEEDRLERFWVDSTSVTGTGIISVFGLLEYPVNAISQCYLILRSYSIFKGVSLDGLMSFTIPGDKDAKRDLYYLIESFKLSKRFLDDAHNDLLSDKSPWEELFKGRFVDALEKAWSLINGRMEGFEQKQREIRASLPLDKEKVETFKLELTRSFSDFRKGHSWLVYLFEVFPSDVELRKHFKKVGRRSLIPRDMFVYGLSVFGQFVAADLGRELGQIEVYRIVAALRNVAVQEISNKMLSQEALFETIARTPLGSNDLALLLNITQRIQMLKWPIFRDNMPHAEKALPITLRGEEYFVRFFFYQSIVQSNEAIIVPMGATIIESEEVPLIEINEAFRFSDYTGETSEKVEFVMELVVKSIFLIEDRKALLITFPNDSREIPWVPGVTH